MYIYIKDMAVRRVWSGVKLLKLSSVLSFEANLLALALVSHYVFITSLDWKTIFQALACPVH